ncbi:SURP and G-patch domain-containing protein 1-like protein [Forsythia ovata]|uniref:SURP and G-patch domain-containing protein 1-like protein n=1 Tax=Forsythia ovata TaxID=205694 RepID=A0ABD1WXW3_9LAMI
MEKATYSSLFVNDGSFLEKFKQLQQEKDKGKDKKSDISEKSNLKQKSKLVAPFVKLGEDEDEDEKDAGNLSDSWLMKRPKLDQSDASEQSSRQVDVAACQRGNFLDPVTGPDLFSR